MTNNHSIPHVPGFTAEELVSKIGFCAQLKGGVIMDVVNVEQALIAEEAGACAVMALERVPADIRKDGGVSRASDPDMIASIQNAVSIPVMAKVRIGHFVEAQMLESMEVGAKPITDKAPQPAAWVRTYQFQDGKEGRAFCSTQGASEDILSEGVRRMIVNATLWCMNMEDEIKPDSDISFVGPYNPTTFNFKPSITDARPDEIQGWDTPILKAKK